MKNEPLIDWYHKWMGCRFSKRKHLRTKMKKEQQFNLFQLAVSATIREELKAPEKIVNRVQTYYLCFQEAFDTLFGMKEEEEE